MEYQPAFLDGGWATRFVVQENLYDRLVRITLEDGSLGLGEIVRRPRYPPEGAAVLEDAILPTLVGVELAELPLLVNEWRQRAFELTGLAVGIDTALHDLIGRRAGVPVSTLLGGPPRGSVPEVLSLSSEDPGEMAQRVRQAPVRYRTIQANLGRSDDLDEDMRRVEAVLAEMGADQMVLADFNGLLTPEVAIAELPGLCDDRIVWEEPCSVYGENLEVAESIDAPVLLDQCLKSREICVQAAHDGAAWGMVIKPGLLGGLAVARFVRDLCSSRGIKMRIDGPWSGQIGAAAALHLAIGAPSELLVGSIDLTGALDTRREMVGRPGPGRIGPVEGSGLGHRPDDLFVEIVHSAGI